jgi:hypothetical protein
MSETIVDNTIDAWFTASDSSGRNVARRWPSFSPALPDADSSQGVSLAIDQIDRAIVSRDFLVGPEAGDRAVDSPRSVVLRLAAASMRTAVMVVLASLAVLVLLPAAIAAQAAAGI